MLNIGLASIAYCEDLQSKTPRGMALIALLNERFPVKQAMDVVLSSPMPALSFLHKSFGKDYTNVQKAIKLFLDSPKHSGAILTVIVYLDCGPCRYPRRPKGLFPLIEPEEAIGTLNTKLQREKKATIRAFKTELEYIKKRLPVHDRVRYIIHPGLEDNFTKGAVMTVKILINSAFYDRPDVVLARNPRFYKDGAIPIETHKFTMSRLSELDPGDILSADGNNLLLNGERCSGISFQKARAIMNQASRSQVIALLWRPENQGLPVCAGSNPVLIPPSKRTYRFNHKDKLKELLRD